MQFCMFWNDISAWNKIIAKFRYPYTFVWTIGHVVRTQSGIHEMSGYCEYRSLDIVHLTPLYVLYINLEMSSTMKFFADL